MTRVKTFVATGIAPDGRLYAGDLNSIQDAYVSLSDFTQTLDVGILRVGDPSLQLLKYGAGEFRMTGSLRVDGILRALGGIVAGAYTTTQRDAIPAGSRPYGLIILNTTTNQYEWNNGTDPAPSWVALGGGVPGAHAASHAPNAGDALNYGLVNLAGTRAARPAASSANNNLFYFDTDWNSLWRSNGSGWVRVASWPKRVTVAEFSMLSPSDGDEVLLEINATTGVKWHLVYNAASASPYKWENAGGSAIYNKDDTTFSTSSTSYTGSGPSIAIPRAGEYDVTIMAMAGGIDNAPTTYNHGFISILGPGLTATDANAAENTIISGLKVAWGLPRIARVTLTAAGTVTMQYRCFSSDTIDFFRRVISAVPVRIA